MTDSTPPHVHARGKRSEVGGSKWWQCAVIGCDGWQFASNDQEWYDGVDQPRPTRRPAEKKPAPTMLPIDHVGPERFASMYRGGSQSQRECYRSILAMSERDKGLAIAYIDAIEQLVPEIEEETSN